MGGGGGGGGGGGKRERPERGRMKEGEKILALVVWPGCIDLAVLEQRFEFVWIQQHEISTCCVDQCNCRCHNRIPLAIPLALHFPRPDKI